MTDVLIVEDEEALAMVLATALEDAGYAVVGTAGSVHTALQTLSDRHVDLALLDVNLGRQKVFPVSDQLATMGIPFIFVTGCSMASLPMEHRGRPLLDKPHDVGVLIELIEATLDKTSQGRDSKCCFIATRKRPDRSTADSARG